MKLLPKQSEEMTVDMAPLIDCVFLLLIFFLVATTLKKTEPELPIDLPQSGASLTVPVSDDLLTIGIDAEGTLYLQGEPVTTALLIDEIQSRAAQDPEQKVRIDADRTTSYEMLIEVIELCQFEGLTRIGLHTRLPEQ